MSELKKKITVSGLLGLVSMLFLFNYMDDGGIKKYAVAVGICVLFMLLGRKKKWSLTDFLCVAIPTIVYILLGGISTLFSASSQMSTIKILAYCLIPLILVLALHIYYGKEMERIVDIQFLCCFFIYLISNTEIFIPIIKAYRNNFIVLIQSFRWESSYAFAFGVFAIYYAYKKRWGTFIIAMIAAYIANKRIVLLAAAAALAVMGVVWLFRKNKKLVYTIWGAVIGGVYCYLLYIYSGGMAFWSEVFNLNSNGRLKIYARIIEEFEFSLGYFGKGLGVIENLLEHWNITTFANLHNDLLKFYIELGFWGLLIYLLSYYLMFHIAEKQAGKSALCYLSGILAYTVVLFATDNVSIYLMYLVPFYSTIFAVLSSDEKKTAERRNVDANENN